MKPQDVIFFTTLAFLIYKRNPNYFVLAGVICLTFAMPLFGLWIFFTAQRFVMYAAAFFLIAIILLFIQQLKKK